MTDMADAMCSWVLERTEAALARFVPDLCWPRHFVGCTPALHDAANLAFLAAQLHAQGIRRVGKYSPVQIVATMLSQIDGQKAETFYSFFTAESLLAFGRFDDENPVIRQWSSDQRQNAINAVDTSTIYSATTDSIGGYPNNYWAVLARAEHARDQLGLLKDRRILDRSLLAVRQLLGRNPRGYFDDSRDFAGRIDIYSPDFLLFLEPLWPMLDPSVLSNVQRTHVRLFESIALENGATVAWGRSVGALSLCLTMELGAMSLKLGLSSDPARTVGLIANAFEQLKEWFADDLIAAHRGRMTYGYRGIHRLLQMTFDCLAKVAYAAAHLRHASLPGGSLPQPVLFPPRDEWIGFEDSRPSGVWMLRHGIWACQFPLVAGVEADYVPWFHQPGMFENPVDTTMYCGVPRIMQNDIDHTFTGPAESVKKMPLGLMATFNTMQSFGASAGRILPAKRTVQYRFDATTLHVSEDWQFDQIPQAISLEIPEAGRPIDLNVQCENAFVQNKVAVSGMGPWRSFWGELANVHQLRFEPAQRIQFTYTLTPALKVANVPGPHDYNRALFDAMPKRSVVEHNCSQPISPADFTASKVLGDSEIFHLGWPEHLLAVPPTMTEQEADGLHLRFIDELVHLGIKIIWTLHNRRPHDARRWPAERADQIYHAWAKAADGVVHHSRVGRDIMLKDLPFKTSAVHAVIAHGHYGPQMKIAQTRAELEREFGLKPCAMRFGLLGRSQPEKQTGMILQAFHEAGRVDQQLIVTAYDDRTPRPQDDRIIFLPRSRWLSRSEIARHAPLCDALISAHTGERYLTSGIQADALAVGATMLVPQWDFFHEILGDAALYHDNTLSGLRSLLKEIDQATLDRAKSAAQDLAPQYDWSISAAMTIDLYRAVLARA